MEWTKWCNLISESEGWIERKKTRERREGWSWWWRRRERFLKIESAFFFSSRTHSFSFIFMSFFTSKTRVVSVLISLSLSSYSTSKSRSVLRGLKVEKVVFERVRDTMITGFPIHFLSKEAKFRLQLRFIIVNSEFSPSLLSPLSYSSLPLIYLSYSPFIFSF